MKKIFNPTYKRDYLQGYDKGLNPFTDINFTKNSEAFKDGFISGRSYYESVNGRIAEGIPNRIITENILEEFLMAGLLGLSVDTNGYTFHQKHIIETWYQSGLEKNDPSQILYLSLILEENRIKMQ